MEIVYFTKYNTTGASSRLRSFQYFPYLRNVGYILHHSFLISDIQLQRKYRGKKFNYLVILFSLISRIYKLLSLDKGIIVVIEKELFPWFPYSFEKIFLSKLNYILDYDDAIFHNYDSHSSCIIKFLLANKHKHLIRFSSLVMLGNNYLFNYASKYNDNCVLIPTVVNLNHYTIRNHGNPEVIKIVWIGSPSTLFYLKSIKSVFTKLSDKFDFTLRVIGISSLEIKNVNIECLPWSEDTEASNIANCSIGIMPLHNTCWELGKCGYKLIQYMACSLPVVASRVGANVSIIDDSKNGFLVGSSIEWFDRLAQLLTSRSMRKTLGTNGRIKVEKQFCIQKTHITYVKNINNLEI